MPPASGPSQRAGGAAPPPLALAPGAGWRQEFPGQERQLGVLRRRLAALLPPCPARDDLIAVANEFACNAVRHTRSGEGGRFTVEVTWHGAVVRVAVTDSAQRPGRPRLTSPTASTAAGCCSCGNCRCGGTSAATSADGGSGPTSAGSAPPARRPWPRPASQRPGPVTARPRWPPLRRRARLAGACHPGLAGAGRQGRTAERASVESLRPETENGARTGRPGVPAARCPATGPRR